MLVNQYSYYNNKEGASGVISDTDITTVAAFANLFKSPHDIGLSLKTIIRTDAAISVRLNRVGNDAISVAANTVFECDWMAVSAIFITAAAGANLKITVAR